MEDTRAVLIELARNVYIQSLGVFLLSLILARVFDWFITRVLSRFTRSTASDLDERILELLHKPVFYTVVLAGTGISLALLQPKPPLDLLAFGFIKTLATLIWVVMALRMVVLLLEWMTLHPARFQLVQPDTKPLFEIGAKVILIGGGTYFFLISWGIDVTAWLASAGIIGIAVGFAARDTLANLFAGVFILADAPYKVGDWVVLDGGERGQVTKIGLRSTRLLTRDDIEITVPNANIGNAKIINESGGPHVKYRNRFPVGVAYGSDVDQVRQVLLEVARSGVEDRTIVRDPEPRVRFRGFGDSALLFELLCWIDDPVRRGLVQDLFNTRIYKALSKAKIEIPFPKRDVYIKKMPGPAEPGPQD